MRVSAGPQTAYITESTNPNITAHHESCSVYSVNPHTAGANAWKTLHSASEAHCRRRCYDDRIELAHIDLQTAGTTVRSGCVVAAIFTSV